MRLEKPKYSFSVLCPAVACNGWPQDMFAGWRAANISVTHGSAGGQALDEDGNNAEFSVNDDEILELVDLVRDAIGDKVNAYYFNCRGEKFATLILNAIVPPCLLITDGDTILSKDEIDRHLAHGGSLEFLTP